MIKAYPWQQKPRVVLGPRHAPHAVCRLNITLSHGRKSEPWGQVPLFPRGKSRFSKRWAQFSQGHMASEWGREIPRLADWGVPVLPVHISVPAMTPVLPRGLLYKAWAADQQPWHLPQPSAVQTLRHHRLRGIRIFTDTKIPRWFVRTWKFGKHRDRAWHAVMK